MFDRPTQTCTVLGATLAALTAFAGDARAQGAVEVTASTLNVRSGPSTGDRVLGQARQGQVYAVVARSGVWARIQFGATTGWSHGDYLRASSAQVMSVTASSLNVRTGADTRFRALGTLPRGAQVAVRGSQGAWRQINYQARTPGSTATTRRGGPTNPAPAPAPAPAPTPRPPRRRRRRIRARPRAPAYPARRLGPRLSGSYAVAGRRWGKPAMHYGIVERIARRWRPSSARRPAHGRGRHQRHERRADLGHASHQKGVDVDVRPVRTSGEGPVTRFMSTYSRARTSTLIGMYRRELSTTHVFFNDNTIAGTQYWREPRQSLPRAHPLSAWCHGGLPPQHGGRTVSKKTAESKKTSGEQGAPRRCSAWRRSPARRGAPGSRGGGRSRARGRARRAPGGRARAPPRCGRRR
ncbi:MAG: SH3 domain-containing protein [Planctomycetota bacterium]|nr:SH3 domain-containing protein [Planctomycetota bacterium]